MARANAFKTTWTVQDPDVLQQLQDVEAAQARENLDKLKSIIKVIEFCGRQNIPLRGHRESDFSLDLSKPLRRNPGNILALIRSRLEAGDLCLLQDFHISQKAKESGGKKVTYLSPSIQNEIIECCGSTIRDEILAEVRAAKFFTVLADEAADNANWEQLPLVLRFVDSDLQIREELVDFVRCESVTGEAISQVVLGKLREFALRPEDRLRGQGYDGAGNMAGPMSGCAARITEECPKALYMHCSSHCLNLCIVALSNIALVRSIWTELMLSTFFTSTRQNALNHWNPPSKRVTYELPHHARRSW